MAPGTYYVLNVVCIRVGGKECHELILDDPSVFRDAVATIYRDEIAVKFILTECIASILNNQDPNIIRDLVKLLMESPEEFKVRIKQLMEC